MTSSHGSTPLTPGARLGPYEILAPLGSGGMGEVYRARDTKLQREVALKVLPPAFADDPDRLARFRREAQLLASLNHPHIGAIFGVEEGDRIALVLELVDGRTLAERIQQGAIPWKEAIAIAIQIADGLEAAHERDVVHRDLKPANIKLATSGRAKVLDFGLAKVTRTGALTLEASGETAAETMHVDRTREGTIVGTVGYMSPEQARGQEIDKRTDIWAFGCVLFEMLSGRSPFAGSTATDTLAAIVERDPPWQLLPNGIPTAVVDLLRRCLAKDPKRRFHDLADVRIQLEDALASPVTAPVTSPARWRPILAALFAGIVATAVIAVMAIRSQRSPTATPPVEARVARLLIVPSEPLFDAPGACATGGCGAEGLLAISPDGRQVVYAAGSPERQQLYVRAIDQFDSRAIAGTEGGRNPTFSPDGRMLAFIADRKLKRVSLDGGASTVIREFVEGDGLNWGDDGNIYFNPGLATGVWRIPSAGGTATAITSIGGEFQHRFPELLPGGSALLYSRIITIGEHVLVQSLKTEQRRVLVDGVAPHYLPTGHLIYVQSGQLKAIRFDLTRLEVVGAPTVVIDRVGQTLWGTPQVAVSRSGSIAYLAATGESTRSSFVWVTQQGVESPTQASGRPYVQPRLSPDGRKVLVALRGNDSDIWEYDFARETSSRLTFDSRSSFPVWAPDGAMLTYGSGRAGPTNLYQKPLDGSQQESRILSSERTNVPLSWSPDGKTLAFVSVDPQTAQDIWTLNIDAKDKARPFLQTPFREGAPAFSPDGRWMAYVSDESGRNEIYVRPFPGPGQKWAISIEGGNEPVWPRHAQQLFYRNGDAMMVVDVRTAPEFSAGKPRRLFERSYERSNAYWPNYDVTPDGQRLLMIKSIDRPAAPRQINVVLNWLDELKQRVP